MTSYVCRGSSVLPERFHGQAAKERGTSVRWAEDRAVRFTARVSRVTIVGLARSLEAENLRRRPSRESGTGQFANDPRIEVHPRERPLHQRLPVRL